MTLLGLGLLYICILVCLNFPLDVLFLVGLTTGRVNQENFVIFVNAGLQITNQWVLLCNLRGRHPFFKSSKFSCAQTFSFETGHFWPV